MPGPGGERQIFELLSTMAREKLISFAAHRYDPIRRADIIAVLVDGALAEMGTHDELERNARVLVPLPGPGIVPCC